MNHTYAQALDDIMEIAWNNGGIVHSHYTPESPTVASIQQAIAPKYKIYQYEVEEMIKHLREEGYLRDNGESFWITFKGLDFYLTHGGKGHQKIRQQEINTITETASRLKRIKRNEERIVSGTWFAGGVGLLVFLWQIRLFWKHFFLDFLCLSTPKGF